MDLVETKMLYKLWRGELVVLAIKSRWWICVILYSRGRCWRCRLIWGDAIVVYWCEEDGTKTKIMTETVMECDKKDLMMARNGGMAPGQHTSVHGALIYKLWRGEDLVVLAKKSLVFKLSSDNHLSFGSRQFPGDNRNDTPEITEIRFWHKILKNCIV